MRVGVGFLLLNLGSLDTIASICNGHLKACITKCCMKLIELVILVTLSRFTLFRKFRRSPYFSPPWRIHFFIDATLS